MLRFTLKQLNYFIAVAECKSISEASKRVFVAQPAVSSAISKLEEQLGISLIIRHHAQGVELTPAGRSTLVEAKKLVQHAVDFQEKSFALSRHFFGEIYIGCYTSFAPLFMPSIIYNFGQNYPEVSVRMVEGTEDILIEKLRNGEIELALIYDVDTPKDIEIHPIHEAKPYVVLPKDHRLTKMNAVSIKELAKEPFVLLNTSSARQTFNNIFHQFEREIQLAHYATSLEMLRGMIGLGLGISLLVTQPPSKVTYDGHCIEVRPILEDIPSSIICVAKLKNTEITASANEFLKYCGSEEIKTVLNKCTNVK